MKNLLSTIVMLGVLAGPLLLDGCATTSTTQSVQVKYVQACAAYNAAFKSAYDARVAGRLTPAKIHQITLLDSQITPICTGPLPADPTAATQQITAAVTTLTVLAGIEVLK